MKTPIFANKTMLKKEDIKKNKKDLINIETFKKQGKYFQSDSNNIHNSPYLKKYLTNSKNANLLTTEEKFLEENEESEKKLKEKIALYSQTIRKNDGASANTLFKIRSLLVNWLKDSEQDNLEYSKFMTEKKIKYLLKNKEGMESKMKFLEMELDNLKQRKIELESQIGNIYMNYELDDLETEITLFENCNEIRSGKPSRMLDQYEEMRRVYPLLKEYIQIKENENTKFKDKIEIEKIAKNSLETLGFLSNYYKNLRKKIQDLN